MPPTSSMQRQQRPPPQGRSRNEAFENIFGRSAVGHHLGHGPSPHQQAGPPHPGLPGAALPIPPGAGYGYPPRGPRLPNGYNPAQPSLPPGQPSYPPAAPPPQPRPAAPPPRVASYGFPTPQPQVSGPSHPPRPVFDPNAPQYGRTPHQQYTANMMNGQQPSMDRRTSTAPSTYSSHSSSSVYAPERAPSPPRHDRLRSAPAPHSSRPPDRPPPHASAYGGYENIPSPASAVFPHRGGAAASPASQSTTSLVSPTSPILDTKSRLGPDDNPTERLMSPPPDYTRAMSSLSFDDGGRGPLDDIAGIPKRGESSMLGGLMGGEFTQSDDHLARGAPHAVTNDRAVDLRQSTSSNHTTPSHRRMQSDVSITSSHQTMTSIGRPKPGSLSIIDQNPRDSPYDSPTTPTGSDSGRRYSSRKSMDSVKSLPITGSRDPVPLSPAEGYAASFSGSRREVLSDGRSSTGRQSSRLGTNPPSSYALTNTRSSLRSMGSLHRSSSSARAAAMRSIPQVYPALLSQVANAFRQLISLSELIKEGITYKEAFDGRTAVTIIADIIKTPDRNLALLLGRALDAQKYFHDVTYDHRLRDNPNEIYRFRERLTAPFMNEDVTGSPTSDHVNLHRSGSRPANSRYTSSTSIQTSESTTSFTSPTASSVNLTSTPAKLAASTSNLNTLIDETADDDAPSGVFTLLTDCYSPTCSRESLCYSINCPRRLEQMKRLNMKPQPGLTRKISDESLRDIKETGTLWIHSVSKEILDSVDDTEKKRQEAINEVIYTERDFVRDLEYLRDSWVKPLKSSDIIHDPKKREDFVTQVFWNVQDVLAVNHVLAERLTKRQKQQPVVQKIGDIFKERVPQFDPFIAYGSHQLFGKFEFEKEKSNNPAFQRFVDETERKPESRKLELNGYLTKPTTRLGRYPLLLEAVLKYTPEDNSDKRDLPEVIKMIKGLLAKVNIETGKSENIFELAQIEAQLVFRPNETIDLRLKDKSRELVHKGPLKRRGGNRDEIADLTGFLFDHAFLLVKPKHMPRGEQLRVYRRPIPLELLVVVTPDEQYNSTKLSGRSKLITRSTTSALSKTGSGSHVPPKPESKHGYSITIIHLGKKGYSLQLWVDTYVGRKKWLEAIDKQQTILRDRSCVFVTETITDGFFGGLRKINCISPYDNGNRMIYGTDEGVYFSNLRDDKLREPVKVINLLDVTQVDVIEEFQLLIVLHERMVTTFPLDCLDPSDPNAALKRGKRIASHTSFFKSGICLGKMLVAVVKSSTLSSTIKVLEPIDQSMRGKKPQTSFMKRLNGGQEALKLFKEFYIPTESSSIHFLKTKLCVGCTKGFEIVDLETLDMQGLLDPSDPSLDFVLKRDNVRPIAIYRIEEDFLLCYDEFAFYVNKNGWRARPKWAIVWEGMPTAFALQYPYIVAFEPTFVEVHHVETGHLVQILPGSNISCLFADTPPSRVNAPVNMPRQLGYQQPPQGSFRPPGVSPFTQMPQPGPGLGPGPGGFPGGPGATPFPQPHGAMRPPPRGGFIPMQPPPQPVMPRFLRQQVIYTSDDGHVQFLKFPPAPQANGSPNGRTPAMMHRHRMSH